MQTYGFIQLTSQEMLLSLQPEWQQSFNFEKANWTVFRLSRKEDSKPPFRSQVHQACQPSSLRRTFLRSCHTQNIPGPAPKVTNLMSSNKKDPSTSTQQHRAPIRTIQAGRRKYSQTTTVIEPLHHSTINNRRSSSQMRSGTFKRP